MGNMRFKVGDRVRIKSLDWYNKNKTSEGCLVCGSSHINPEMICMLGKIATISSVEGNHYRIKEYGWNWTDEMIEGLVEEETALNKWTGLKVELELSKSVIGVSNVESLHGERFMSGFVKAIIPPEGYQFVDENGNVINTTKIVLEKKKKEYPKTYEECAEIIAEFTGSDCNPKGCMGYMSVQLTVLQKLLICRDAYWKIAGEEMGLGKPWEPSRGSKIYLIGYILSSDKLIKEYADDIYANVILSFPTEEMRDAFYENFKEEIESCKELL